MVEDRWGRLYVGTQSGVDRLDPASGRIKHYSTADGLAQNEVGLGEVQEHRIEDRSKPAEVQSRPDLGELGSGYRSGLGVGVEDELVAQRGGSPASVEDKRGMRRQHGHGLAAGS